MKEKIGFIMLFGAIFIAFGVVGGMESDQIDLFHGTVWIAALLTVAIIGGKISGAFME